MDSFVPHLQLNSSRTSGGEDRLGAASRLNQTAAPFSTSAPSGAGYNGRNGGINNNNTSSSSYNNNTSMTNNTLSSDVNEGGYGADAAPPSPVPRFNEKVSNSDATRDDFGVNKNGYAPFPQCWPESTIYPQRYADPLVDRNAFNAAASSRGSCSVPGPSTVRPLFTSESASNPRDANVLAGETSRVPLWGGGTTAASTGIGDLGPRDDFLNRYSRSYGTDGLFCSSSFSAATQGFGGQHDCPTRLKTSRANPNALTSTYVETSNRAMPTSKSTCFGSGGVDLLDFDQRGGTRSLESSNVGNKHNKTNGVSRSVWIERQYDDDDNGGGRVHHANGLVNSRSRARADRWTDENTDDSLHEDEDETTSLDAVAPPLETTSSNASTRHNRRGNSVSAARGGRNRRQRCKEDNSDDYDENDDSGGSSDNSSDDEDSGAKLLSFADAVVRAMDAQPVVPLEMLRRAQVTPFIWIRHPSHGIVLSLLQHRGIYLPRYRELVDYHMAELFLHYIDLCREGAFFVHYAPSKWPKERFFRIRMLPVNLLEAGTESVPHLVITLHESGVHILDAIPLDNLVGVTISPQAACFRPFLESPNTIIGCREGRGHRTRMPIDGAFSLWFYDVRQHTSRSVDILTCDAKVFDIWTKTFRGLVSVNSSSVVQVAMTPQGESAELAGLTQAAREQSEIDHGERKGKCTKD